jgi:hypothetical protein
LRELEAGLARRPRRHGARALRALLERDTRPAFTRSQAERRLLALVRAAGLPAPEHNVTVAGNERDLVWFEHGSWSRPTAGSTTAAGAHSRPTGGVTRSSQPPACDPCA